MIEITPPLTEEDLIHACNERLKEADELYHGITSSIQLHINEEIKNVDRTLFIPQPLIMVDDSLYQLGKYLPHLISINRNNGYRMLFHNDACQELQTEEQLATELIQYPDSIILMDGELEAGMRGERVIHIARSMSEHMNFVGFSGSSTNNERMINYGAITGVVKRMANAVKTMRNLTDVLQSLK